MQPVQTFTTPPFCYIHCGNAFESSDGKTLHVDLVVFDSPGILNDLKLKVGIHVRWFGCDMTWKFVPTYSRLYKFRSLENPMHFQLSFELWMLPASRVAAGAGAPFLCLAFQELSWHLCAESQPHPQLCSSPPIIARYIQYSISSNQDLTKVCRKQF